MAALVIEQTSNSVATLTLDDGKANALSPEMQRELHAALDRVELGDARAVVIAGNAKLFSGGFDLSVFAQGDRAASLEMLEGGFALAVRLLSFRCPVVIAATGHAIAMGAFLLLCGDHRVGSARVRCQANEVAIGMTLPTCAIEIMRMRLTPAASHRAISMAASFAGEEAIAAGWLDEIVDDTSVLARAGEVASAAATALDPSAHLASKLRARGEAIRAIQDGIDRLDTEITARATGA